MIWINISRIWGSGSRPTVNMLPPWAHKHFGAGPDFQFFSPIELNREFELFCFFKDCITNSPYYPRYMAADCI